MALTLAGCGLVLDLDPRAKEGVDGKVPEADGCVPAPEECNGVDDDCDGRVDEGFELTSDPSNCGGCGRVCPSTGGSPSCVAGLCEIECAPGRADCDGEVATGCEADLGSPSTCGACDVACGADAPTCMPALGSFVCAPECEPPLVACEGSCVDLATDRFHCGSCGGGCFEDEHGTLECVEGSCRVVDCGDWHADCNGDPADGCERFILTETDCGECDIACAPGQLCLSGVCGSP